jgi:hypothetical protein
VSAPPAIDRHRANLFDRLCLAAAFALPLAWFFTFNHFRPDYLVDESGHLGNIYHFLENKPGWPEQMTMLPGYHWVVVALWKLHPPCSLLTLARLVTTATAWLALGAFFRAWKNFRARPADQKGEEGAGAATLTFALLPIFQPFTALAYTDVPAIACVLLAFAAQFSRRYFFAALALTAAALVRQTTLAWAAFLIALEIFPRAGSWRETFPRVRWLVLLLASAAAAVLVAGRLTPGTQTGNELHPNPASIHFAGLLALLFGLPVWLAHARGTWQEWRPFFRVKGTRGLALALAGTALGFAALLALTFRNPHAWNREFFWDDGKFTLLRNWPLIILDTHPWLRALSGLNLVAMAAALALIFAHQPHRRTLWLALAFGAVLPALNSLVEPRYFLDGAVGMLLFLEFTAIDRRRLMAWWALLCAALAPFIARGVALW